MLTEMTSGSDTKRHTLDTGCAGAGAGSIRTPASLPRTKIKIKIIAGGSDRPIDLASSIELRSHLSAALLSCPKDAVRRVSLPL
jgi:hypothetical protein